MLGLAVFVAGSLGMAKAEITPPFGINGNDVISDVAKRAKVEITYDVRPVRGRQLELFVVELPVEPGTRTAPFAVWDKPYGKCPLKLGDLPAGVYMLRARALDAEGKQVADLSRPEYIRYGGEKGRQNYEKRAALISKRSRKAEAFADIVSLDQIPDLATSIKPAAKAIKPGETLNLTYTVDVDFNMETDDAQKVMDDYDTQVYWKLEGAGKLRIISATEAIYEAPEEGDHLVKVRVRLLDNEDEATIFVTNSDVSGELQMQQMPGT